MIAAGKEMTEFVCEENGEESKSERQASGEAERVFVKEGERAEKLVGGEGFVPCVGIRELRASQEASTKREQEEDASDD